jgi:hypothetical protein
MYALFAIAAVSSASVVTAVVNRRDVTVINPRATFCAIVAASLVAAVAATRSVEGEEAATDFVALSLGSGGGGGFGSLFRTALGLGGSPSITKPLLAAPLPPLPECPAWTTFRAGASSRSLPNLPAFGPRPLSPSALALASAAALAKGNRTVTTSPKSQKPAFLVLLRALPMSNAMTQKRQK